VQGAILACLPRELAVTELGPSEWRKRCGLPGNASKSEAARFALERWGQPGRWTPAWTIEQQDALDAFCLAWAVREMTSVGEAA
jgi:hypothetical protein